MEKRIAQTMSKTLCPVCGEVAVIHAVRDLPYSYKGHQTVIAAVEADWCDACGESMTGPGETGRVMQAMGEFQREVNVAQGAPALLGRVRRKLGLSQRGASRMFGGGVNAFNRYESGKAEPPLALIHLLGLLDRHPELLEELRELA